MFTKNGNILKINGNWLNPHNEPVPPGPQPDPYNPLNLPTRIIRVRTNNGRAPVKGRFTTYEWADLVPGTTDVYDVKSGSSFHYVLYESTNVVEVLGANGTNITNMESMFNGCSSLTSVTLFDTTACTNMSSMYKGCTALTTVPLYDTSACTNMYSMLAGCSSLTAIPLFNTSNVTNMNYMCSGCRNVQSGALSLYQQASSQTTPPSNHDSTFYNCGSNTTTGTAELAQIPSDWK